MTSDNTLTRSDILDPQELARRLCDPGYGPSATIASRLPAELVAELRAGADVAWLRPSLVEDLLRGLNSVIAGPALYDEMAFGPARLTQGAAGQVTGASSAQEVSLANRLLLSEAYPREIASAYASGSEAWYRFVVEKFAALQADFQTLKGILERVLNDACRTLSPLAIVQVRVKTVSSFAEKAWRKGYAHPIRMTTDPVGARIIAETQDQVAQLCEYVKRSFEIDETNSIDHQTRLDTHAFGYLSVHYIVMLKRDLVERLEAGGLIPQGSWSSLDGWKAEVQVRTLLQHAHATISHDRVYKSPLTVPETLQRDLSRVSAMLEQADRAFGHAVAQLESYYGNYGRYLDKAQREKEIGILRTALAYEPNAHSRPRIALELAKIYKCTWDWAEVVEVLRDHRAVDGPNRAEIRLEYGNALCRRSRSDVRSSEYLAGLHEIEAAVGVVDDAAAYHPVRLRVQGHAYLGWARGNLDSVEDRLAAESEYRAVYRLDKSNPYSLAARLEFAHGVDPDRIEAAVALCRSHARAGIEIPWAYLTMGRLHLLAGELYLSLSAYCKAIQVCGCLPGGVEVRQETSEEQQRPNYPREVLDDERRFLINVAARCEPGAAAAVQHLLDLALCVYYDAADARGRIERSARRPSDFLEPVRFVSGGADPTVETRMQSYADCISGGFVGFSGTLISGGTTAGVPGLVGALAEELRRSGHKVHARCYLPMALPADAPRDNRYDQVVEGVGERFSPLQPLLSWVDLIVAGVMPQAVRLIGINGGQLSAFEYKLALALGARVGVVRESGRAAADLAPDEDWVGANNLLWLPPDPQTIWAFLQLEPVTDSGGHFAEMGRLIHERYVDHRWGASKDKKIRPWQHLQPNMRASNIEQAAHSTDILARYGYRVEPAPQPIDPYVFSTAEDSVVEAMAEMEHGRWNVERLADGWSLGPSDAEKKTSPYLLSWRDLNQVIRQYDIDAVRDWPALLAEVGLKVVPPGS